MQTKVNIWENKIDKKKGEKMVYGYYRTSTKEQHLDRGIAEIKKIVQNTI